MTGKGKPEDLQDSELEETRGAGLKGPPDLQIKPAVIGVNANGARVDGERFAKTSGIRKTGIRQPGIRASKK